MATKRLNIMLYSDTTGEQIILPINPNNIEIKYEKSFEKFEILGFGEINISGNKKPAEVKLSHFLPENNSTFETDSGIMYEINGSSIYSEEEYSSEKAIEILKKWALGNYIIRLVIDDELNLECMVVSFAQTIRESIASKPYTLDVIEYRNPSYKTKTSLGLIKRLNTTIVPDTILMKSKDTVYSIADKYGLDFSILAKNNGIEDVNATLTGTKLNTQGALLNQ